MIHSLRPNKWISLLRGASQQPLFYNALFILGVNVLPAVFGLVFWGIASRLYTAADIGLASAAISAVALVSGLAGPGFNLGIIRFLPDASNPVRFLNTVYTAILLSSIVLGGIYLAGLHFWSPGLLILRQTPWYIAIFLLFVASVDMGAVVRDTFVARRQANYSLWYTLISNGTRLALVFFFAELKFVGLVTTATLAFTLALLVSWLLFLPLVEKNYRFRLEWDWSILRTIGPFSFGNYLVCLLGQLTLTVLPLMVLEVLGPQANGYAYIALILGGMLISPGVALATSAFAEGASAAEHSMAMLTRATQVALLVTLVVALVTLVGAPWILRLFGVGYASESSGLLRWYAVASIPMVVNQLYFTWLRLRKETGRLIVVSGSIAVMNLAFAYLLMTKVGIVATGIGALLSNSLVLPFVAKELFHNRK
jgi:O-antigen/teichoic acid export membrane protein